jgi:hypothetical protein
MAANRLATADRETIIECLNAVASGPFFDESDLRLLSGATRGQLLDVIETGDLQSVVGHRFVGLTLLAPVVRVPCHRPRSG